VQAHFLYIPELTCPPELQLLGWDRFLTKHLGICHLSRPHLVYVENIGTICLIEEMHGKYVVRQCNMPWPVVDLNFPDRLYLIPAGVIFFHFHRIFAAMTGETIADHVRRMRLEKAAMTRFEKVAQRCR